MDESPPHPRRYAKACDACHKKKIRCVYSEPTCELCTKTGQVCRFTRMEKALPKKARRGKYLAALEERMKNMESLLHDSQTKHSPQAESPVEEPGQPLIDNNALATIISRGPMPEVEKPIRSKEFQFPPRDQALRLAQGYLVSCNYVLPIFCGEILMRRMKTEYPPDKFDDLIWWTAVVTVLCYAHRLRAMSSPAQADVENHEACRYLKQLLDVAPQLSYGKASFATAQILLGIASIFRGTAMPDPAPMLVSVAIRMLQSLDAHKEESPDNPNFANRKERACVFWVAYILDKDIALLTRKPPVLVEHEISRVLPVELEHEPEAIVRSLDSYFEVNLFTASQRLAAIQGQVWNRVNSASRVATRSVLKAAQDELNPALVAWKDSLPFGFKRQDLVGRWPKHAIVHIVVLHFRYFHTLVELNKEPPMDDNEMNDNEMNPLNGNCPLAKSLPSYPHSTNAIPIEAARDALDLASLTPRGNFQNVWMFFEFSISAVLTLLVNGIVRPLHENAADDLRRVDTWLGVIELLATSSERWDLLQKKEFLVHMRTWTLKVSQDAACGRETVCSYGSTSDDYLRGNELDLEVTEMGTLHPDVFPLEQLYHERDERESEETITWPYLIMPSSTRQ